MLKEYLIICYAYLVKTIKWDLEPVEGSSKKAVPKDYRTVVAERLTTEG